MKILFPYLARWKSVNWTRYHSILTCLSEMGHEIYVLQPPPLNLSETNFQEIDLAVPRNLHLIDISLPDWLWHIRLPFEKLVKKGLYSVFSLNIARQIIKSKQIDLLLLYNLPQYFYVRLPVPIVVFDCADDYIAMLQHELGSISNRMFVNLGSKLLNKMIEKSNTVFAVSNVLANKLNGNVKVLPNGVDLRDVEYANNNPLKMNIKRPVVGFIGSFEYFIDFELILEVAALMPNITFLIVGSGRMWEFVKRERKNRKLNNILLPGAVPHKDIFRYIGLMDICLNPFMRIPISHGACPIKLFEYLAMKKPVISTRLDELNYIDKKFLLYGDNAQETVSRIDNLISDKKMKNKLVEAGFKFLLANYTWQSISAEFLRNVDSSKQL